MTASLVLTMLVAAAGAATPTPPATAVTPGDPALARADAAAAALTTELLGRLRTELDAGGPAKAIAVCSEVAPAIAARLSRDGLTVRRVGTRVRNPANTPDPFEAAVLARWQEALGRGVAPKEDAAWVEAGGVRTLRVMRPITTGKLCLACHGPAATLAPAVRAALAERYPSDRATGYREGELRGAVSVTVVP
ncbi:MAG: DUF3365 domain-containing protein [Thermoanaerobaculaceae bacterium]|nr:DUF3365 domain-containing protein [Thermoanaerobaculaceae bacterium]TAM49824.1 MAG: DUF3365 domain-containing protein [Acidobacteriota bacterium]